jgi:hypothetical protein
MNKIAGVLWAATFFLIAFVVAAPLLKWLVGLGLIILVLGVVLRLVGGAWSRR